MVLIEHKYLKSDIFFNPIFIPGFSGSRFFRVQGFRVGVQGPDPRSRAWVQVQGPGPGYRSSPERILEKQLIPLQRVPL